MIGVFYHIYGTGGIFTYPLMFCYNMWNDFKGERQ